MTVWLYCVTLWGNTSKHGMFGACVELRAVIAQSLQRWATGWTIGVLRFDSRRGLGILLFTTASKTALGPTQPPIQWVPGARSLAVKLTTHLHLVPRSRMRGAIPPLPNTSLWRGTYLSTGTLLYLYSSRRVRWLGHAARLGEMRNAYRILVGKPGGKKQLGRRRRRWENIKMDRGEIRWEGVDLIHLNHNRDQV
jgi:hypothetical protein